MRQACWETGLHILVKMALVMAEDREDRLLLPQKQGVSGLASTPRHGDHNMHVLIPCLQGLPRTWQCVCQVSEFYQ